MQGLSGSRFQKSASNSRQPEVSFLLSVRSLVQLKNPDGNLSLRNLRNSGKISGFMTFSALTPVNFFTKAFQIAKMKKDIEKIPETAEGFFAPRPHNMSISMKKFEKETGYALRSWENALKKCISVIKGK